MKFLHLSDLHIGKRVNEFPMLTDQKYIFNQIFDIAQKENIDAVVVAGDVYDKGIPTIEAVELFDGFLNKFRMLDIPVLLISGNHDSSERLDFGGKIFEQSKIYIAGVFDGLPKKVEFSDTDFYLLPFVKPQNVKRFYPDCEIENYEQAVKCVIDKTEINAEKCNVLVAHQLVTAFGENDELSVGGVENIDFSVFDKFDYVALGHLHEAKRVGRETVRYGGSPLKYSTSEVSQKKCVTLVETGKEIKIEKIPLVPLHDMREIKGPLNRLISPEVYMEQEREDYLHVTLTDEERIFDAIGQLRRVYPNIMRLDFENRRTAENSDFLQIQANEKTPLEMFKEFYRMQNNEDAGEAKIEIISAILDKEEEN